MYMSVSTPPPLIFCHNLRLSEWTNVSINYCEKKKKASLGDFDYCVPNSASK